MFIMAFLAQSPSLGLTLLGIAATSVVFVLMVIYAYILHRYLQSSKKGLGWFQVPVPFYSLSISIMLCTSVLLWLLSGVLSGVIVVIGAFLFVVSDSLIAVKEFHHRFSKAELKIVGTYYSAILLFPLNVLVFTF